MTLGEQLIDHQD